MYIHCVHVFDCQHFSWTHKVNTSGTLKQVVDHCIDITSSDVNFSSYSIHIEAIIICMYVQYILYVAYNRAYYCQFSVVPVIAIHCIMLKRRGLQSSTYAHLVEHFHMLHFDVGFSSTMQFFRVDKVSTKDPNYYS